LPTGFTVSSSPNTGVLGLFVCFGRLSDLTALFSLDADRRWLYFPLEGDYIMRSKLFALLMMAGLLVVLAIPAAAQDGSSGPAVANP
jgi:hypothetical protein